MGGTVRRIDAHTHIITTIAGGGSDDPGDNGPATAALLENPSGIAADGLGNLYIADSSALRVRVVDSSNVITTIAGTGAVGYSGDGGPAIDAEIGVPAGVAVDASGNLYIADSLNAVVRRVDGTTRNISTIAGSASRSGCGDSATLATNATFLEPFDVKAVGDSVFVVDRQCYTVRRINSGGHITTVAGGRYGGSSYYGSGPSIGDAGAPIAAGFDEPTSVAVDSEANIFIADPFDYRVRGVDAALGVIATVHRSASPWSVAVDSNDDVYVADRGDVRLYQIKDALPKAGVAQECARDVSSAVATYTRTRLDYYEKYYDAASDKWGPCVDTAEGVFRQTIESVRVRCAGYSADVLDGAVGVCVDNSMAGYIPLSGKCGAISMKAVEKAVATMFATCPAVGFENDIPPMSCQGGVGTTLQSALDRAGDCEPTYAVDEFQTQCGKYLRAFAAF